MHTFVCWTPDFSLGDEAEEMFYLDVGHSVSFHHIFVSLVKGKLTQMRKHSKDPLYLECEDAQKQLGVLFSAFGVRGRSLATCIQ